MEIAFLILVTVGIVGFAIGSYLETRNDKVYAFRLKIIDKEFDKINEKLWSYNGDEEFKEHYHEYLEYRNKLKQIHKKYTYDEMLYSLRPLKMEEWFTPEELELLK